MAFKRVPRWLEHWVNGIISGRNPSLCCTLTLTAPTGWGKFRRSRCVQSFLSKILGKSDISKETIKKEEFSHGGKSRSRSAEQGKHNKIKRLAAYNNHIYVREIRDRFSGKG